MIIKERLSDIKEEYEKAHRLIDEESKNDPPTEPYRSHYLAKDILNKVQTSLKASLTEFNEESDITIVFKAVLGNVLKDIGKINIFTDELSNAELVLMEATHLLGSYKSRSEVINVFIEILNQLGILWSNRGVYEESKKFLDEAEVLYIQGNEAGIVPMTISDLFGGTKDEVEKGKGSLLFEKNYTLTLYYIAQVYGYLGQLEKSAHYCHKTLKRQLEFKDYEPIDWALNAATLSQYYFPKNHLNQARHLLAASQYMLDQYEPTIEQEQNESIRNDKRETHLHRSADVARCWAKYGIHLLSISKDRLMDDQDEDDENQVNRELIRTADKFDLPLSVYEGQITDEFCLTFEDSKLVLLSSMDYLNKAKLYYTKDTECSEYAKIIQDISSLYKFLAFFDEDESNQCKLYKRSADQLEELDGLLNVTYYQVICREIWYELGLIYSKMLDNKLGALDKMAMDDRPTPHALNKINKLCEKSIQKFKKFIESYKIDMETLQLPETLDETDMQPILYAFFHIARLYYKIITPDRRMVLTNVQNSYNFYYAFVEHCNKHEGIGNHFKAEMGVCKEMVKLLPLKIKSIKNEIKDE